MLRQVLSAFAPIALLADLSGCGDDKSDDAGGQPSASTSPLASASESPTPGSAPPQAYKKSPGQGGTVKTTLTSASFTCTEMPGQYFAITACSKGNQRDLAWFKYVTDADGTVVFANTSKFADTKAAITAVVGATDANVLLAEGSTLKWGYAGPGWVMINGLDTQPEPPQPTPYENSRAAMISAYSNLNCHVGDPDPSTPPPSDPGEVQPSPSSTPAVMSYMRCSPDYNSANTRSSVSLTFADDKLTAIAIEANYHGDTAAQAFRDAKAAAQRIADTLWPALRGGDAQALKSFVEPRLTPTGSGLGYVDGHKVRVESTSGADFADADIVIRINAEQVGLEEKN
jgi:hypothetical protein